MSLLPLRFVNGAGQSPVQGKRGSKQSERLDWVASKSLPALNLRFCIGKCLEPTETVATYCRPAHPLLRALGTSQTCRASRLSRLSRGISHCLAWPPYNPTKQAVIPDAKSPSQPADYQEHTAIHRGISCLPRRIQRAIRPRHIHLPFKAYCTPTCTCPSPMVQTTTLAITGPPNHPATPQEGLASLQKATSQPRPAQRAGRSLGHSLRGSPQVAQWLNNFFALPLASVAPQLDASLKEGRAGGQSPQTLGAGLSPQDSDRTPVENPQIQVPPNASLPLPSSERPHTSLDAPQTNL